MKKLLSIIAILMISGCGRFGYKSEYSADTKETSREMIAAMYYGSVDRSIEITGSTADKLAQACIEIGSKIGTGGTTEIISVSETIGKVAQSVSAPIAAPTGYLFNYQPAFDAPSLFDSLPNAATDDFSDIKEIANGNKGDLQGGN